jgi:cytochrome c peroxidase
MMSRLALAALLTVPLLLPGQAGQAASPQSARQAILDGYAAQVRKVDPQFKAFSAAAGRAFFLDHPAAAQPATPSCSACHTTSPLNVGHTRAGKEIQPMAVSRSPQRFTDPVKVERWFTRNCHSVYGRACTAEEKGNFIAYMSSL